MSVIDIFKRISVYVKPYKWLVFATLMLTLVGSFMAQVNAIVLNHTVDSINDLVTKGKGLAEGVNILILISSVLLGKELMIILVQFGQKFFGQKLRICITQDLAQHVIEKELTYRLAFFTKTGNEPGKP